MTPRSVVLIAWLSIVAEIASRYRVASRGEWTWNNNACKTATQPIYTTTAVPTR
ncbi:hypothetical protein NKJ36_19845 [Mesorhizobium sp. M0142]|uniref:hypothetical protein n=1 Tax=unclassified Mesorhizobium TaxID=325217 RepID=UPI00333ACA11